ncbi:MAG: LacI family transcriptional regulator [Lachnospiraceae bacterium]|nr:LacI family transcriptional regulator [Lachnospiraceae bacterium]
MATIREVAREAGCSIATVSRVMSGDSMFRVTEETKQRIDEAVKKLDYRPPVRAVKRARIGCILSITAEKYSDPFFMDILSAIERECEKLNISITGIKSYSELTNPITFSEFLDMDLSAVILMESVPEELLTQLKKKIPIIIFIDNDYDDYSFHSVGFDHRLANKQVMDCLIKKGYRRIGLISGSTPGESIEDSVRLDVYRHSLEKAGIEYDPSLIRDCFWDKNLCIKETRTLMSLESPPDAIFAGSDSLAEAVLSALHDMSLSCPSDVGVIGFNNLDSVNYMIPKLTTVSVPTSHIGEEAVRLISETLEDPDHPVRKILFPTELIERDSLKKEE